MDNKMRRTPLTRKVFIRSRALFAKKKSAGTRLATRFSNF